MKEKVRALIVDDERGAYINLSELLTAYCPEIEVSGYASTTEEAEIFIQHSKPDLVFLDIQMPGETGIAFIKRIWPINFEVIFVTAYDEFALKVFKLNALDYILKPISITYLQESMARTVRFIQSKANSSNSLDERFATKNHTEEIKSIVLKFGNDRNRFLFDQITHLHASGSYTTFYFLDHKKLTCGYSLAHFEDILPENLFKRTHKSYVVNIELVKSITTADKSHACSLVNNEQVPISRRRLNDIKSFLK